MWLRDECNYQFGLVTADQFQSDYLLQTLKAAGFETGKRSVDRDKGGYVAWRTAFEDGAIRLYQQDQLLREVAGLIERDRKVEHSATVGKDTADAACGAFMNAFESNEALSMAGPSAPSIIDGLSVAQLPSATDGFGPHKPTQSHRHSVFKV